ncbi:MAG TPA: hypothetical protein VFY71_11365 [Planctomycetota bacterium]|nr:hypothetical protein [Planctomycetota bacterium]
MKSDTMAVVVAGCLSVLGLLVVPASGAHQAAGEEGRLLFQQDVSQYAIERGPRDGAPGASSIGFRVSDTVQGGALIVGLDRPALGVFVGLNTPNAFIDAPYADLHLVFTLADGSTLSVKPVGGGGTAMLFQSPDDVPVKNLRKAALYVDSSAEWAK